MEKSPDKEETLVSQDIQAWELDEDFVQGNSTFKKGGFVIFMVDGQNIDPPVYIEREQFLEAFKYEQTEEMGKNPEEPSDQKSD